MNEMNEMIDVDGSLTPKGYEALQDTARAVSAWRNHPGGREAAWHRMMMRNSYTIDPRRPEPDDADEERDGLYLSAREAVERCLDGEALTRHDAAVRGWPTGGLVA